MTAWLVAWLLQGIVAAVVVGGALRFISTFNAATRYVVWWVTLGVVAALALVNAPFNLPPQNETVFNAGGETIAPAPVVYIDGLPDSVLAIFVGVWAAVALIRLVRIIPIFHAVYALRDRCRPFPPELEPQLALWREVKDRGRRTELVVCDELPGATMLGFHRPCVALPPSLLRALDADDLDQIILHEYAHVQRRDDWARLAQEFVQAVLWAHPAAAMIGRALDREREMACDEWVVARTRSPKRYARCLTLAAQARARSRQAQTPTFTPALFGARRDLVRRVDRLLTNTRPRRGVSPAAAAIAVPALLVAAVQLGSIQLLAELGDIDAPLGSVRRLNNLDPGRGTWKLEPPANANSQVALVRIALDPTRAERQLNPPASSANDSDAAAADSFLAVSEPVPQQRRGPAVALESRSFLGVYANHGSQAEPIDRPGRWRRVGNAAAQLGVNAGKTGAGLGNAVSRASVSVARRF